MPSGTEMLPLIVGQLNKPEPEPETPDDVIDVEIEDAEEVVTEVPTEPKPGHVK
jgi:hypothetical protein